MISNPKPEIGVIIKSDIALAKINPNRTIVNCALQQRAVRREKSSFGGEPDFQQEILPACGIRAPSLMAAFALTPHALAPSAIDGGVQLWRHLVVR